MITETIFSPIDQLEVKYPMGHPIRENDRIGVVVGYEVGSSNHFVLVQFEDGHRKKVKVPLVN